MRRKNILIPLLTLSIASCSGKTNLINIICPVGAPAFAFYKHAIKSDFETNSVPLNIIASMNKASDKTVVVIDTVSGLRAINNGAPYKIAATITFGNFYICSTGNDDNGTMDKDDNIVIFGENTLPDFLFNYVYGKENFNNLIYVNSVSDAAVSYITKKATTTYGDEVDVDYVFLAQPAIFANKATIFKNVQEDYTAKSNGNRLTQASVFIKDTLNPTYAKNFLEGLKSDIEEELNNPDVISEYINQIGEDTVAMAKYGTKAKVATAVTKANNGMGLGFEYAIDNKDDIDAFVSLFGMEKTNEKNYFK